MEYLSEFQTFLKSFQFILKPQKSIMLQKFSENNQKLYQQLRVDIIRGLHRFRELFPDYTEQCIGNLRALFERYFIDVVINSTEEQRSNYYQGITDAFEIIFGAFMNPIIFVQRNGWFTTNKKDGHMELLVPDIAGFFDDYQELLGISNVFLNQQYTETKFQMRPFLEVGTKTLKLLQQKDKQLYNLLKYCNRDQFNIQFLKYSISYGLHFATDLKTSVHLSERLLTTSVVSYNSYLQFLLSCGSRGICKDLKGDKCYQFLQLTEKPRSINDDSIANILLQEAIPFALKPENFQVLTEKYEKFGTWLKPFVLCVIAFSFLVISYLLY